MRLGTLLTFAIVAAGMAPMLAIYLDRLWTRKHYQFYPILIAATAMLLTFRWKRDAVLESESDEEYEPSRGTFNSLSMMWARVRPLAALTAVGLGIFIEFLSLRIFSPWLGYLGFLLAGLGVIEYLGGRRSLRLWPAWALMALILMPPGDMDSMLITRLQQRTASFTGRVLDVIGIDYVREGVVIEIPARTLFIEEACSGVQSLFSLVAIAAVLSVWHARPAAHFLLLTGCAIFGAAGLNVFRTVAIVYGLDRVGIDLLLEPQHSLLGMVVFLIGLGWLACCDGFLTFVCHPIDAGDVSVRRNLWVSCWNRFVAGQRKGDPSAESVRRGFAVRWLCRAGLLAIATSSVLLAAKSASAVLAELRGENLIKSAAVPSAYLESYGKLVEGSMPADFDGWRRVSFKPEERSAENLFGMHSRIWTYQTAAGVALCSVDYPFYGWHDLRTCYQGYGWDASEPVTFSTGGDELADGLQFILRKASGDPGMVLFAAVNNELQAVPCHEFGAMTRTLIDKAVHVLQSTDDHSVVAQFQILFYPRGSVSTATVDDLRRHLSQFRSQMLAFARESVGGGKP